MVEVPLIGDWVGAKAGGHDGQKEMKDGQEKSGEQC